ncbi:hypothetical protein ED733_008986 [Metarhizium rileyi]|uniref:Uncharacterized protein n=1 Tax=Metarhizium rileyi (strain RCEF 4871) TaxID=1649241 RepID=A0A5C6GQC6_METRR|nr:hypothetical protein ED733_008986 [Metarhizium rileyi]
MPCRGIALMIGIPLRKEPAETTSEGSPAKKALKSPVNDVELGDAATDDVVAGGLDDGVDAETGYEVVSSDWPLQNPIRFATTKTDCSIVRFIPADCEMSFVKDEERNQTRFQTKCVQVGGILDAPLPSIPHGIPIHPDCYALVQPMLANLSL